MKAKFIVAFSLGSILLMGCNMNPNKEARIRKLERDIQESIFKINSLEKRAENFELIIENLNFRIQEIENQ